MKAIVTVTERAHGKLSVTLLGYAFTEMGARIRAARVVNGPPSKNGYDYERFEGGVVVEVSQHLEDILLANGWDTERDEVGNFVSSKINDNYTRRMHAVTHLRIENGILYTDFKGLPECLR